MSVAPAVLLRTGEVYEVDRIDFAEAYLVACCDSKATHAATGVASFEIAR